MSVAVPTDDREHARAAAGRAGRLGPLLLVWGAWAVMLTFAFEQIARVGRNVPLSEDWLMVPALTGHQPHFWAWVWSQNNEHRLPVPRLVYLGLLELTGDFRVGMVVNAIVLGVLAAAMILVARRLRGGRTSYLDAFFPVVVLNLGHWENLGWSWQLSFVLSVAAIVGILLVLVASPVPLGRAPAVALAAMLVLLPLTGATGLPYVPAMVVGVAALVWPWWPMRPPGAAPRRAALILIAGAVVSVVVVGLYFIGYERPAWAPANPGVRPTLDTAARFMAMGFGSAYTKYWGVLAAVVVASALVLLGQRIFAGRRDVERRRATALAAFLLGSLLLALAVGYGRAALVPQVGMPDRYALLSVPGLVAAWFAWERYGPARMRVVAQGALLAGALVLLPANIERGRQWQHWYTSGMNAVDRDVDAGVPRDQLVRAHQTFLLHWDGRLLGQGMDRLRDERIGPFAQLRERAPSQRQRP